MTFFTKLTGRSRRSHRTAKLRSPRLCVEALEEKLVLAAIPTAQLLGVPTESLLGENLSFTVQFDNTSAVDVGFGPYVNLYLPATGIDGAGGAIDDGITFVSATYLGTAVQSTVLTLTAAGVPHPFARDSSGQPILILPPAGFRAGDQLIVLLAPFGSFTPDQPPVNFSVTASLSNLADLNAPLPIRAEGGFRFGNDSLDNPTTDPTIVGQAVTSTVNPTLFRLTKTYIGPEDETATGSNFPRQYQVSVDVATGQTITDLDLTDILPPELQFLTVDSTSGPTTSISTPSTTTPGGTLTRRFASVVGTAGAVDAQMTFSFFAPLNDGAGTPNNDPVSGDDQIAIDDASTTGTWTPLDPRDPTQTVTSDATPNDHTLTLKSIATQKSSSIVNDVGAPGLSPGDTLEYVVQFQVSDYFAFQNLVLTDLFSDGQEFVFGSATLSVSDGHVMGGTTSGAFATDTVLLTRNFIGGTDQLVFAVSNELIRRGFSPEGRLVGGAIPIGGTGGPPPQSSPALFGPTQGTVRFRTVVQDRFEIDFPSGDPALNQKDSVSNSVVISGDLLNVADLTPNGNSEADNSSVSIAVQAGSFSKAIYAINGVVGNFTSDVEISPGDTVTYRLIYTFPTGDVENLVIRDFLPLPIFDVDTTGQVNVFEDVVSGAAPGSGRAKFGPTDTFRALTGIVPGLGLDSIANSLTFNYGTFDDPSNTPSIIDLLFTVTVSNDPFADELLLTNGAQLESNNTILEAIRQEAIVQITLRQPELNIKKGVVAAGNPDGLFTPTPVGPVSFNDPGTIGARFTGTITSAGLAATPIDSNLRNVDSGDLVTFAIVIENTGGDTSGAFDLLIRDTLPAGTVIPGIGEQGYNLRITDGAGNLKAFRVVGQGLFDPMGGIELLDSPNLGAIGAEATDGSNLIIVTFDLQIANVNVLQSIPDTATLANYASTEGGPNFIPNGLTDDATVRISREDLLAKTLIGTEIVDATNSNTEGVIGELVTYQVTITVPEATMPNAILTDRLDEQLAFVDLVSVSVSPDVTFTGSATPVVTNNGGTLTFNFGDITNANRDNNVSETITLTYRAVILNVASAQGSVRANNLARLTFEGLANPRQAQAEDVTIIEPRVLVNKSVAVDGGGTSGDAGDTVAYTITLRNPSGNPASTANAFDLTFSDPLPFQMGNGSLIENPTFTVSDSAGIVNSSLFELVGDNATGFTLRTRTGSTFDLLVDDTRVITLTIQGTLPTFVVPGQLINNTAETRWTSLDGDPGQRSVFNLNSVERTGAGGINDYAARDDAPLNITNVLLAKSVVSTSELATLNDSRVVVGEIVRFRLQAAVPEGQSLSFRFLDDLPAGLQFLDDGTARIAFVSNGGGALTSTTIPGNTPNLSINGNETNVDSITPLALVPSNVILGGPFGNGTDVTFNLGTVTNGGMSDADREFIVIEFNALVTNVLSNQADATLANSASVVVNNAINATNSTQITVAEPLISAVNKNVLTSTPPGILGFDAGDRISYRVGYSNNAGAGAAIAYDVRLQDFLVSGKMLLDANSVRVFRNGTEITTGFRNTSTDTKLDITLDVVAVGDAITVLYDVILSETVIPGETLINTADVQWTSLPGLQGTANNPTGSTVPGSSGTGTGERNGDDGPAGALNNHAVQGSASLALAVPEFSKQITSTSPVESIANQFDPNIPDFVIGELVTYRLTATLQEGTTTLTIQDVLPTTPGVMRPVSSRVVSIGSNIRDSNLSIGQAGLVNGQTISFDFGTVVNASDNIVDARDQIVIEIVGQVLNVPANVEGTRVVNTASLDFGSGSPLTASATGEIIEPALTIVKEVVAPASTLSDGNDLITYRITVEQDVPNSTAIAFNVLITDVLPTGLTLVGTPIVVFHPNYPSSFYDQPVVTVNGNSFSVLIDYLDHPDSPFSQGIEDRAVIEFQARVNSTVAPGTSIVNTSNVQWDSFFESSTASPDVSRQYTANDPANVTVNSNSLSGVIYVDLDDDGLFEPGAGETLITSPVTLQLTGTDHLGNVVNRSITTTNGSYSFDGLRPSDASGYTITQVNQPQNFADGRDTPGTLFGGVGTLGATPRDLEAVRQIVIPLGSNATGTNYNFGELPPASLGDFLWNDLNGNGLQDLGEPGRDGQTVTLTGTNPDGSTFTLTTTTANGGIYAFNNLRPGSYTVQFTAPSGFIFTLPNVGNDDTIDSDVSRDLGTASVTLGIGEANTTIDAGVYEGASLAGFVYRDFSIDGIRQPNGINPETGIGGVTLILTGFDNAGNPITPRTTITNPDGSYLFDLLSVGTYTITEVQPPSVFDAGQNGFYDGLDGVGTVGGTPRGTSPAKNVLQVTVDVGEDGVEYNFGENPPADPFGFVYIDLNNNGIRETGEPGIPGVAITVSGTAFAGTPLERPLTAADLPGGSLTVFTDANGRWEFPIMPPGVYSFVQTQPLGFLDGREENADPNAPMTVIVGNDRFDNVVLSPFPNRGAFNFGELAASGSLSGSVYVDFNNNGFRDAGELGIPGVTVTLTGTDLRGEPVLATVITDAQGNYRFRGMFPGTYRLTQTQPVDFVDGQDRVGSLGGVTGNDVLDAIVLGPNETGVRYLFGELGLLFPNKQQFLASSGNPMPGTAGSGVTTVNDIPGVIDLPGSIETIHQTTRGSFFALGTGPGVVAEVRILDSRTTAEITSFRPFGEFMGGIQLAMGDVNADGFTDVIVGAGPGAPGGHVKIFSGRDLSELASFLSFPGFQGGISVASADMNADGFADVVVGAGPGAPGGHVKVFSGQTGVELASFFSFPGFMGGVSVGAGDVNGDGRADVIVGAGAGAPGGHVKVFSANGFSELASFFAFGEGYRGGLNLAVGDTDGDGLADIVAGANQSNPHVKVFRGGSFQERASFLAFPGASFGVHVGLTDRNGDGRADVLALPATSVPHVRVFDGPTLTELDSFFASVPTGSGLFVAGR